MRRSFWECFRDPSEFLGPLQELWRDPFGLIKNWPADSAFYRRWYQNLRYYDLDRHRIKILLGYRFLYGLRSAIPFAIGATGFRALFFAVLSGTGTGLWVGINCLAGAFLAAMWR